MRKLRFIAIAIAVALSVLGCKRIELYEPVSEVQLDLALDLKIDLELDLAVETDVEQEFPHIFPTQKPDYMEVLFYDANTHKLVNSYIISSEGGKVDIVPGDYNVVVFNFSTESTQVMNLDDYMTAEAFTTDITKSMGDKFKAAVANAKGGTKGETKGYEDDPIIYEPDHLFVANEVNINIPSFEDMDKNVVIRTTAKSILDIYSLEVLGVKGTENIEKVEAFVTGQIKSSYFASGRESNEPATLYIEAMNVDVANGRLYTVFGTFGKLPKAENNIYLDITITNTGGGQYRYIFDVTEQFDDDENVNNQLVIDAEIDIPEGESGGGGLAPEVGDWEEENVEIPLG